MLCRDRTSRVSELASAHRFSLHACTWDSDDKRRPTRCLRHDHVAVRPDMVHCWRTSRLSS
eukprot:2737876-Prymnesium_polylepis.1